jgi:hypothetical protein
MFVRYDGSFEGCPHQGLVGIRGTEDSAGIDSGAAPSFGCGQGHGLKTAVHIPNVNDVIVSGNFKFRCLCPQLVLHNSQPTMDYSHGSLTSMCSPFFPQLRQELGPFLVDKTKLIKKIADRGLTGKVELVLRPRRCGKTTMLQMLRWLHRLTSTPCTEACCPDLFSVSLKTMMMIHIYFSVTYISQPKKISAKSTWASIQLSSVISKFVVLSKLFRQLTYVKQNIIGDSWEGMFQSFRVMVSVLYKESYEYLGQSLDPEEKEFYESIRFNRAPAELGGGSLQRLSYFLARKSGWGVMVFIDEYEVPDNCAYKLGYFDQVRPSYPSRLRSTEDSDPG